MRLSVKQRRYLPQLHYKENEVMQTSTAFILDQGNHQEPAVLQTRYQKKIQI